ncbi:MAG: type I DNA topoisomerase [Candidatus Magasanikbacteria bacterium]
MSKKLVIVESPKKAKTISKFLDNNYRVEPSYGHIRDLPKSEMGVELENNTFEPQYTIPKNKADRVKELKDIADKSEEVIFATDGDREGEAISWHLAKIFGIDPEEATRIEFHEITQEAIEKALKNPRSIDKKLVNAQQARRVLDRLVGYELSPLLWKKVAKGLSAGRVQSVALKFIVERERERQDFEPQEYWSLKAELEKNSSDLEAKLRSKNEEKLDKFAISSEAEMDKVLEKLEDVNYIVKSIKHKQKKKKPKPPFTTSYLQQQANYQLNFSSKKTMTIAQQLYEGIDLGQGEQEGLITYMRTDSLFLSDNFLGRANGFVESTFGDEYQQFRKYQTESDQAQEAHEAIRPTAPKRTPKSIKDELTKDQFKLYNLIWKRSIATQIANAKLDHKTLDIKAGEYGFRATGQTINFDGWLKLYPKKVKENTLPKLSKGDELKCNNLEPKQHFTKPPARFSDATLVKELKEHDIGRPSTYAPTISKIEQRQYVTRDKNKKLKPTDIAFVVNDLLTEHFSNIVDTDFTAKLEQDLDHIASGDEEWKPVISDFYKPFHENIEEKTESISKSEVTKVKELGEDPESGEPIFVKVGKYGPYIQKGTQEGEKPDFAPIPEDIELNEITMEDAQKLLTLPKKLGTDEEGNDIIVDEGRYGPYLKCNDENYSLEDDQDPYEITLEQAKKVIKEEKERQEKKEIKTFDKEGIKVLNGPYGPYVTDGDTNVSVPDDKDPSNLNKQECQKLLEEKNEN